MARATGYLNDILAKHVLGINTKRYNAAIQEIKKLTKSHVLLSPQRNNGGMHLQTDLS